MKRHLSTILAASLFALAPAAASAAGGKGKGTPSAKAGGAAASKASQACVECHSSTNPAIVQQWKDSGHARKGVGCLECHRAEKGDADAFEHNGSLIATIVTPRDCARCHAQEDKEFERSHHAKAGNILASLDNFMAETVEGSRERFNPHAPAGAPALEPVNGMASAESGCQNCHGTKVALRATDGGRITVDDLKPGPDGKPTHPEALAKVKRDADGRPIFVPSTWPNTGIGRMNLDGSLGGCTACHSRHDFSPRRARQPENCGKCHLGPDHPQKEIFEESKHGIAYRDRKDAMGLDKKSWVLGKDYTAAPTCASCHMSANVNGGKVTHDPGERISWTNRPPISQRMDTDANHNVVTETDPARRRALVVDTAEQKRDRMKQACNVCHAQSYVNDFYAQYDDFERLYNEKFARPGKAIIDELRKQGLITPREFDEKIEWDWFYLWHHEGRRARHGVAMNAPDYAHWHGMFEVAERFYQAVVPEAREIARAAAEHGKQAQADAVNKVIDGILARPEHAWYLKEMRSTRQVAPKGAAVEPQPPTKQTLGK